MRTGLAIALSLGLAATPAVLLAASPSPQAIGEVLRAPDPITLAGEPLDGPRLRALYEGRAQQPLWIAGADLGRVDTVVAWLGDAASHGLDPANYHLTQIAERRAIADERMASELDLLVSDGVLRFVTDVRTGRRPPVQRTGEVDIVQRPLDTVAMVRDAAAAGDLRAALEQLPPHSAEYQALRDAMNRYRKVASAGGWEALPANGALAPGASSAAVPVLRRRLIADGDLADTAAASELYDDDVKAAVHRFQERHGLAADGVVSKPTREALNVPVGERVDQIRANLERLRWFPEDLGARHVRVNIVDFTLRLVENGTTALEMPVIVGKNDWRTPVVSSQIEQLVFNPPWNVPPNIIRKEMMGRARANPAYFNRIGMRVYRRGGTVDSSAVDWGNTGVGTFSLQQPPGPSNPLGRVKFHFPNVNGVYLHDTNRKSAFQAGFRAMSHGCIRVGDALGLAHEILVRDSAEWEGDHQKTLTKDWKTRWVNLTTPVPVHVMYSTVWVGPGGALHFARDFYGRDQKLVDDLKRKNAPVVAPPPPVTPTVVAPGAAPAAPLVNPAVQPTGAPQQTSVVGSPAT